MLLSEAELKVLLTLAEKGAKSGYELHSKKGEKIISPSTWHEVKSSLLREKLVRVKEIEENGRKKKLYELTTLGLLVAIAEKIASYEQIELDDKEKYKVFKNFINKVTKYWSHLLPKILGKWELFKKCKVEELFLDELHAVSKIYTQVARDISEANFTTLFYESLLLEKFEEIAEFLVLPKVLKDEMKKLSVAFECLFSDTELKRLVIAIINQKIREYGRKIEILKDLRTQIEHFSKKNPM